MGLYPFSYKNYNLHRWGVWSTLSIFLLLSMTVAIVTQEYIYFGLTLLPIFIYLSVVNPAIFPLGLYVFLVPFDALLALSGIVAGSSLTKLLGIFTILVLTLKGAIEKKFIRPDSAAHSLAVFIAICIVSIIWSIDQSKSIAELPTSVGLFVLYYVVSSYEFQEKEYELIKSFIFAGGVIAAIVTFYNFLSSNSLERSTVLIGERSVGQNMLTISLFIPLAICIDNIIKKKKIIQKIVFSTVLVIMTLSGMTTGSRSGSLGISVIFMVYILSVIKSRKKRYAVVITAAVLITVLFVPAVYVNKLEKTVESGGSGRLTIWQVGVNSLDKYWFAGAGLGNFSGAYTEYVSTAPGYKGTDRAAHNIYLEIFVELGIAGFLVLIVFLIKNYRAMRLRIKEYDSDRVMFTAVFLAFLTAGFFTNLLWQKTLWMLLMMIMVKINMYKAAEFRKISEKSGF